MPYTAHRGSSVLITALASALAAVPAAAPAVGEGAQKLARQAVSLARDGDLHAAHDAARRAAFLAPESRQLRGLLQKVTGRLAKAKIEEAEERLAAEDREGAVELLVAAHELRPSARTARRLRRLGYREHRGAWRTEEEIEAFEAAEKERTAASQERLNLGDSFRVVRTDHFRVHTNMPSGRQWERWLAPVLRVLESQLERYQWVFQGELDLEAGREGLDVVFFHEESDYRDYLEENDVGFSFETAGFYDPNRKSCFFYRDPNHGSLWPILLHELTHDLNDRLLHSAQVPWVSEGLAEYFEGALVNKDHSITIGRPHFDSLMRLRKNGLRDGHYVPATSVLNARAVDDPEAFPGHDVDQAYALMWGWAYFLLHHDETHREILLEGLRAEREFWKHPERGGRPHDAYIEAFERHGLPVEGLDAEFKEFIRSVPLTKTR